MTRVLAAAVAVQFVVVAVLIGVIWQGWKNEVPTDGREAPSAVVNAQRSTPSVTTSTDTGQVVAAKTGQGGASTMAVAAGAAGSGAASQTVVQPAMLGQRPAAASGSSGQGLSAAGAPVVSAGSVTDSSAALGRVDRADGNRNALGNASDPTGGADGVTAPVFTALPGGGSAGGGFVGGSAAGEVVGRRAAGGAEASDVSGSALPEVAEVPLPEGVNSVPAAFEEIDPEIAADPEQVQQLREIQNEFRENIGGINRDPSDPAYAADWRAAQWLADQRYRALYGHTAFLRQQERAAAALSRENSGQ